MSFWPRVNHEYHVSELRLVELEEANGRTADPAMAPLPRSTYQYVRTEAGGQPAEEWGSDDERADARCLCRRRDVAIGIVIEKNVLFLLLHYSYYYYICTHYYSEIGIVAFRRGPGLLPPALAPPGRPRGRGRGARGGRPGRGGDGAKQIDG